MANTDRPLARFSGDAAAVVIDHVTVRDPDVAREARHWTSGERGPAVEQTDVLMEADLTRYVTEALRLGAHALSVTGQAQEARAFETMLKELGDRTAGTASEAAALTKRSADAASEAVTKAATQAAKAIVDADITSRKAFTTAVDAAKQDLAAQLGRLFAGERPELVERLQPVLQRFGADLDTKVTAATRELLDKAVKQFDPADPTSPMAKHAERLAANQRELVERLAKQHAELTGKIAEMSTALQVREATTTLANVTPIKGDSYAAEMHTLMAGIAAGLGDDYADTSAQVGRLPRCKKGDGVLIIGGGQARVVVEMTDSARSGWTEYLDEAERNRDAAASLGLVRGGDETIRVIGPRRVVVTFDPGRDDPELLRTVVMLMRTVAVTATARKGTYQVATAEEKIRAALEHLHRIDEVKKLASSVQKSATRIDGECTGLTAAIQRVLAEALAALDSARAATITPVGDDGTHAGAA